MESEPLDIYCPRCDSAYCYFPEIPGHCWNCGVPFFEIATPNAEPPADHFPIAASVIATLALGGAAFAGGLAVHGWQNRPSRRTNN